MFMLGQTTTVSSASGTLETLPVGETYITVGFDGYDIKEIPELGLQPDSPTPSIPMYEQMKILWEKFYRISQNSHVRTHPALRTFHKPLLVLNDLISRSYDKYLPSRTCYATRVCSKINQYISIISFLVPAMLEPRNYDR